VGSPGGPLCGLRAGSAPAEDETRLLQGHQPAWRLSGPVVRFPWLHIPAEEGDLARRCRYGVSFLPAASQEALKAIRQTVRRWELHHRSDLALEDLARRYNPYLRGWINYYSHFYKSALTWTLRRVDAFLIRWARNKYKRLRPRPKGARDWLARVIRATPSLFAHWAFLRVSDRTSGAV